MISVERFRNDEPGWSFGIASGERSIVLCFAKWEVTVAW